MQYKFFLVAVSLLAPLITADDTTVVNIPITFQPGTTFAGSVITGNPTVTSYALGCATSDPDCNLSMGGAFVTPYPTLVVGKSQVQLVQTAVFGSITVAGEFSCTLTGSTSASCVATTISDGTTTKSTATLKGTISTTALTITAGAEKLKDLKGGAGGFSAGKWIPRFFSSL
jgi:hypothetical protein